MEHWKQEIIQSVKEINHVTTEQYSDVHSDRDIREEYDSLAYWLYYAAYQYQREGGKVEIRRGDMAFTYLRYGTVDDMYPVEAVFQDKNA